MENNNELSLIVKDAGLETSQSDNLMKSYAGFYQDAKKVVDEVRSIVVTSEDQVELMKKAKEGRKRLKDIRVEVEKTRIKLKEQSLREGKAIDGMAHVLKALIIPVEEHLEKQEKFAELKEAKRLSDRFAERVEKLSKYVDDVSLYNLTTMSDEAFESLLISSKSSFDAKIEAQKKADDERIELEKKQKILNERQLELAEYRQFRNQFPQPMGTPIVTIDTTEEEYQATLKKCKDLKSDYDKEQERIRIENEELRKKSDADRKAREEAELKLKKEKEAQDKKEQEARDAEIAKKKLEDDEKRKLLLAPDKEKLLNLATLLEKIESPRVASKEAGEVVDRAFVTINDVAKFIRSKAVAL